MFLKIKIMIAEKNSKDILEHKIEAIPKSIMQNNK